MSRSFKKNPYCQIVCMKDKTKAKIKRMSNRNLRHKINRGLLDDEILPISSFKRIEDNTWTYDLFTCRAKSTEVDSHWYQKAYVRK